MFRNPLTDSIVALAVLLVIFGPKRLPILGRSLSQGIREFRRSIGARRSAESEGPGQVPALLPGDGEPSQAGRPTPAPPEP
jgi:sec-independent protein translocase protein TatA